MNQAMQTLSVATSGPGLTEMTGDIQGWLMLQPIEQGLLTVFCRHTSASLLLQENADPDVRHDLQVFFQRLVREDPSLYRHTTEGPDDMPAHIRAALTQSSLSIPVHARRMLLGTWQGVYLFEHRAAPHQRKVTLHLIGGGFSGVERGPAR